MTTSEQTRILCKAERISLSELARLIGQSPQNFLKKIKRNTISTEELVLIGDVLGILFEQTYITKNGEKITISNQD